MLFGLYYKCFMIVIYDRNNSYLYYKCDVNYTSSRRPRWGHILRI